jgi:hypothetical protein
MMSHSIAAGCIPFASAGEPVKESLRACLVLMGELEASLQSSQKALLALDLAKIECETKYQADLIQRFDALGRQSMTSRAAEKSAEPGALGSSFPLPELEQELRRSQTRILDALRLQTALLLRARAKLNVLGNMLAGPSAPYGPLLTQGGTLARGSWAPREKI